MDEMDINGHKTNATHLLKGSILATTYSASVETCSTFNLNPVPSSNLLSHSSLQLGQMSIYPPNLPIDWNEKGTAN